MGDPGRDAFGSFGAGGVQPGFPPRLQGGVEFGAGGEGQEVSRIALHRCASLQGSRSRYRNAVWTCREFTARKVLTAERIAGSVARMETRCGLVELNKAEVPAAMTSWAFGYWFSFTYY